MRSTGRLAGQAQLTRTLLSGNLFKPKGRIGVCFYIFELAREL